MEKSKIRVIASMLIIFGTGCTADVYLANTHHIPLLEEKGDLRVSGGANYIGTDDNRGFGANASYAITDRVGIGAGGFMMKSNDATKHLDDRLEDSLEHRYGEFSVVYFVKPHSLWRTELMGTAGVGTGKTVQEYFFLWVTESGFNHGPSRIEAEGKYYKLALQTNLGVVSEYVEAGISPKLAYVDFYDFSTTQTYSDSNKSSSFFFEHAIFMRFGIDPVKLDLQFSRTEAFRKVKFDYDSGVILVGLNIKLDKVFNK